MKKILLLFLSIVIVFYSCDKDNNPTIPSDSNPYIGNISTENFTEEISENVGPNGGKVIISNPESVINGMEIIIPEKGYNESRNYTVSTASITDHKFGKYFNPVTPIISIKNGGGYSEMPISVKVPVNMNNNEFFMGFLYDEISGKLEALPVIELNDSYIIVETRHFDLSNITSSKSLEKSSDLISLGNLVISSIEESVLSGQTVINTGFTPGTDDWEFINFGSHISPGGHCAGQSITAMWYYYEKKLGGEAGLFHHFDKVNDSEKPHLLWEDNPLGYRLASSVQEDAVWKSWWSDIQTDIADDLVWKTFITSMLITGNPQFVGIRNTNVGGGHALVAYKIDVTGGKLYVADPNYPGNRSINGVSSIRIIDYQNNVFLPYPSFAKVGDPGKEYDQIRFYATNTFFNWEKVGERYLEFENKTIGNDRFPNYTIYAKTSGSDISITDGMTVTYETLELYCHIPSINYYYGDLNGTQYFKVYDSDGNLLAVPSSNGIASLKLNPGENKLGIYVCAATKESVAKYCDFKEITFYYEGQDYSLTISPNPLHGEKGIEYMFTAISNGTAPNDNSKYIWDFGDNSQLVTKINDSTISHTFINPGSFDIKVELFENSTSKKLIEAISTAEIIEQGSPDQSCPGIPIVSYDGKIYNTVQIGNQCWLKENLDVGTQIFRGETYLYGEPNGFQTNNGIIEKWCYDNDEANCDKYGGLYQWEETMQYIDIEGTQGICPTGWRIPSQADFKELELTVGGSAAALKDTIFHEDFDDEYALATNKSGFSALMAGNNFNTSGHYNNLGYETNFWTSTRVEPKSSTFIYAVEVYFTYNSDNINYSGSNINDNEIASKDLGFSIRCILDDGFDNQPPQIPSNPNPQAGATDIPIATSLSWSCSDPEEDPITFDIYFGEISNPPLVQSDQMSKTYNPGTLKEGTKYYWKVIAKDNQGNSTLGPEWNFTTHGENENLPPTTPSNPTPPNNATDISLDQSISWSCTDPESDPITYDIYFGTNSSPGLVASNQSSRTYYPGNLNTFTKYYWKIIASDDQGNSISSPIWEFTTKESSTSGSVCLGATKTVTYEGKVYNAVLIGNQCWLKENLDIGTIITSEGSEDYQTNNGIIEKFCYNNDEGNCVVYGGLYQWDEAMQYITTEGAQGICPDGWHIPTLDEFETLSSAVNDDGNSLKEIGEGTDDGEGTNTSGFSALLAGDREDDGSFYSPGMAAYFWSSKNYSTSSSIHLILSNFDNNIDLTIGDRRNGYSVRCIED